MVCEMEHRRAGRDPAVPLLPRGDALAGAADVHAGAGLAVGPRARPGVRPAEAAALLPHLVDLHALYRALAAAREKRGAIDFDTVELQLEFDVQGKIVRVVPAPRNDAHKIIEECMLAANVCTAEFLAKARHPALYRVHEGPTPEKLALLQEFLGGCGLTLGGGDDPTASDYAKLLLGIKGRPDYPLLQTVLLRSLQQAQYRPDNVGHFGLSYEAYAHFTSPIRRYPDLVVHRAIGRCWPATSTGRAARRGRISARTAR